MSDDPHIVEWRIHSWDAMVTLADRLPGWLFRGQSEASWGLSTTLDRLSQRFDAPQHVEREEEILNLFKRQAHIHLSDLPKDEDNLEWLSLIQHHGGPTRLLDFTRSMYVAAFFAVEDTSGDAAVWAVNQQKLDANLTALTHKTEYGDHTPTVRQLSAVVAHQCILPSTSSFEQMIDEYESEEVCHEPQPIFDAPNVLAVKPWRLNERMIIQQGWFLFPTRLESTFEQNLAGSFGMPNLNFDQEPKEKDTHELKHMTASELQEFKLIKIILPRERHDFIMQDLHRMNITAATLFPGLDGFARSLRFSLRIFDGFPKGVEV